MEGGIDKRNKRSIIDLLQKSSMSYFELEIIESGDEIEAQAKSFSTVSIAFAQDPEDLQSANDILDQDPLVR